MSILYSISSARRKQHNGGQILGVEGQLGELGGSPTQSCPKGTDIILDLFSSMKGTQWRQFFWGAGAIRGDTGAPNQSSSEPYRYHTRH